MKSLSRVRLLATPWTAAYQAPPSMGFSRQEYWSGVPLPSPLLYIKKKKILKDDAMKVRHSICQQILKTQQWPQDWKTSVFIPIPKKGNAKEYDRSRMWCLRLKPGLFTIWPFTGKKTANTCPTALCVVN